MKNVESVWQEMLSVLEVEVNSLGFDVWIKPLRVIRVEDNILGVVSPTPGSKTEVIAKYLPLLKRTLRDIEDAPAALIVISEDEVPEYLEQADKPSAASELSGEDDKPKTAMLNPKYTFAKFVVGGCNRYAQAIAREVAEHPGEACNPLFIYGDVGLGKTHLMHAIGNEIRMSMPNMKILYVSSDTFINEFIASIRSPNGVNNQSFRDKYRKVDLLMIDDVQFISKKPATADEIFHTFEALKSAGKQMVFASDRPPKDIPDLDSRVRSRFASSVIVDVQAPDLETRVAILQTKAQDVPINIGMNELMYIAERVTDNIREMEGVLTKAVFLSRLYERKVDIAICQEALRDYQVQEHDEINADEIVNCTCRYFNVKKDDLIGKKKNKEIVEPRQIAIYIINELLPNLPLASIGEFFGGREHTTVMHARAKIGSLIATDAKIRTAVNDIKAMALRK